MAFEINYINCSAEIQNKIHSIVQLWNNQSPFYDVKTSGSTGIPKSISLTRKQLESSAKRSNTFFHLDEKSHVFMCMSPDTIGGKMLIIRALVGDYALDVIEVRANPLVELEQNKHYSFISLVPYQVKCILEENPARLNQFDQILLGGMGLSVELETTLLNFKPAIYIGFGMTETVSHIALRKLGSPVYEALNGVEVETSNDCLVITDTELGIHQMQTNDEIELIDSTHFNWLGRADFVINSGGIKIHPEKLEQELEPLISTPFIIAGLPHESFGEECILISEKMLQEADFLKIQTIIQEKFGKYAAPKRQIERAILKTENGKIRRKEMLNLLLND
ncbi:AMP-binding protein [Fluviicola taffensis]|uniref:O-succinylbenzoate--CoA ligase n=1 Tax=Fluviicola taffensis (strain DSM 16823 / NCIMB 13979 / RW262) TaxID=755732 RepID=F2IBM5_FLUTR|nr:AMP-binding protein [Fluviicola taffensis]AEA45351.1 O-succinylbenzoate--CoA ligase [Fluviicola taffensis DSM 16823]